MQPIAGARIALVAPSFGRESTTRTDRFAFEFATHLALAGMRIEVLTTCAPSSDPEAMPELLPVRFGYQRGFPDPSLPCRGGRPVSVSDGAGRTDGRRSGRRGCPDRRAAALAPAARAPAHGRGALRRVRLHRSSPRRRPSAGVPMVEERAVIVPLLEDDPLARLELVRAAAHHARMLLFTTEAEAALALDWYGAELRPFSRVIGMGVDVVPEAERAPSWLIEQRRGRPYVVSTNGSAADARRRRARVDRPRRARDRFGERRSGRRRCGAATASVPSCLQPGPMASP